MSDFPPVALIFGAGANVGRSVARAFYAKGYKVAVTSRKPRQGDDFNDFLHIISDLADPESAIEVFAKVKSSLGIPSVVVYNAAAYTMNDAKNPLSLGLDDFNRDLVINTVSAYVVAQQAVLGFEKLPDQPSKSFIYTGNLLNNKTTLPPIMSLGVGKSATAHFIQSAAIVYADRGFKFYYADERTPDGSPMYGDINGDAHAELYVQLAESEEPQPWQQTFVKGLGYKVFPTP